MLYAIDENVLFPLFYFTREFRRFLHRGKARFSFKNFGAETVFEKYFPRLYSAVFVLWTFAIKLNAVSV